MLKYLFICLLMLFLNESFTQERDTLRLYSGQLLIGEIKGAKLGVITIDEKDLGMLSIKMYKIKQLNAGLHPFRIETNNRKAYYSKMWRSNKPGTVEIDEAGEIVILPISEIAIILPLQKGFFKKLDGNLGVGFSYTKSNKIGQLNLNSTIYYTTRKIGYQLIASAIYSIDSTKFSRDNENIQLFGDYSLSSSWFASAQVSYQRNLELSLARRFQEMLGAGNKLILRQNWSLLALSGLTLGQEKSSQGENTLTLEVPLIFRFNFFMYQPINLQMYATQTLSFSLSQAGRVRYDGTISYSHELIPRFFLSINFYSNYDSKPPESNSTKIDYGVTLSISYRF